MDHVLDNPAWNALISGNTTLSFGDAEIKYFDPEVSPFVGLQTNSDQNIKKLANFISFENTVAIISTTELEIPPLFELIRFVKGCQMVYEGTKISGAGKFEFVELTEKHVPQMLALTKLTKPGPFASRTIEFGQYFGIVENYELLAMAGHRLQPFNYTEISAVCTHPAHLGKGYAKELLKYHINKIIASAGKPFLHVRHDNERAINVYEQLGFNTRTEIYFYFIKKVV